MLTPFIRPETVLAAPICDQLTIGGTQQRPEQVAATFKTPTLGKPAKVFFLGDGKRYFDYQNEYVLLGPTIAVLVTSVTVDVIRSQSGIVARSGMSR